MKSLRPPVLALLCFLTFSGSVYGLLNAMLTLKDTEIAAGSALDYVENTMDEMEENAKTDLEKQQIQATYLQLQDGLNANNFKIYGWVLFLSSLLTLIGAMYMYSLQFTGFYIYAMGTVIGIIGPMLTFGGAMGFGMGFLFAVVGALMVRLYYKQFKKLELI